MLALVFTFSVALPTHTQQAQAPTTKEIITFFNDLKKKTVDDNVPENLPEEFIEKEKKRVAFIQDLESLDSPYQTDPPEKVAGRWLNLLDNTLQGSSKSHAAPDLVLGTIPPPSSWPAIASGLRKNFGSRNTPMAAALVLYGEILDGTPKSRLAAFTKLKTRITSKEPNYQLQGLERRLNPKVQVVTKPPSSSNLLYTAKNSSSVIDISETHWELAKPSQESFFKKLFIESKAMLKPSSLSPAHTSQLITWFKETAPKHRVAQWAMVDELDTQNLYPIITKRFKPFSKTSKSDPSEWIAGLTARSSYLFGLAAKGEIAKAVSGAGDGMILQYKFEDKQFVRLPKKSKQNIVQFLSTVAKKNPGSKIWQEFGSYCDQEGFLNVYESVARAALDAPKVTPNQRAFAQFHYAQALLWQDNIDAALPLLLASAKTDTDAAWDAKRYLSVLSTHLKRPDLKPKPNESEIGDRSTLDLLKLIKQGKFQEVKEKITSESSISYVPDMVMSSILQQAVARGNTQSVIEIVDAYEWTTPMTTYEREDDFGYVYDDQPMTIVGLYVRGLIESGKLSEASSIIRKQLFLNPIDDENLLNLIIAEGDAAIPLLDKMAAANPYEERPLIWKAKRLLMSGRLAEAATAAFTAIKIDPSDGETKGGRRMLVYNVFADILEAQGKLEDAQLYRNAVAAVRKSELADQFLDLRMNKRAVALYQESLQQFADAYCIQSRLAHQLATMGRRVEALEHYRKAYELMSSSFGFVETHCFGCEDVFEGEDQQKMAESVFLEQIQQSPLVPQNHYLLGYLREEQGRLEEAAKHFRQALRLAPTYANAAKHLLEMNASATPAEKARWIDLVQQIKSDQTDWDRADAMDFRQVYDRVLAKREMFGIKDDPNVSIRFKLSPLAMQLSSTAMPSRYSNGSPGGAVASQPTVSLCISLVQFLHYKL